MITRDFSILVAFATLSACGGTAQKPAAAPSATVDVVADGSFKNFWTMVDTQAGYLTHEEIKEVAPTALVADVEDTKAVILYSDDSGEAKELKLSAEDVRALSSGEKCIHLDEKSSIFTKFGAALKQFKSSVVGKCRKTS